ncbi:MAG: LysE family translocator [Chloroflexi bacterium]|nr:LysE family translocator [Chloroflexota bacterium]
MLVWTVLGPYQLEVSAMPQFSNVAIFLLAALGYLIIPGPAVLYITSRSVAQGRRAGLASVLGIELASLTHVALAAFGLSALLLASPLLFDIVKYLGAAYLISLGVRTLLAREGSERESAAAEGSFSQFSTQGYLVNLLSPKSALFFYAFLPQFVDPAGAAVVVQVFLLGALFVVLACCTDSAYCLLGSTAGQLFTGSARFGIIKRYASGGVYIIIGLTAAMVGPH